MSRLAVVVGDQMVSSEAYDRSVQRLDKDVNRTFYNEQRYDERRRFAQEPPKVHAAELLVPWVVRHLRTGDRVIDIAGGAGTYPSDLVRAAAVTVVGLDISESMIDQRAEDPLLTENVVGDMEAIYRSTPQRSTPRCSRPACTTSPIRPRRCEKRDECFGREGSCSRSSHPHSAPGATEACLFPSIKTSSACPAAGSRTAFGRQGSRSKRCASGGSRSRHCGCCADRRHYGHSTSAMRSTGCFASHSASNGLARP